MDFKVIPLIHEVIHDNVNNFVCFLTKIRLIHGVGDIVDKFIHYIEVYIKSGNGLLL